MKSPCKGSIANIGITTSTFFLKNVGHYNFCNISCPRYIRIHNCLTIRNSKLIGNYKSIYIARLDGKSIYRKSKAKRNGQNNR